jgi:hypothetical protein
MHEAGISDKAREESEHFAKARALAHDMMRRQGQNLLSRAGVAWRETPQMKSTFSICWKAWMQLQESLSVLRQIGQQSEPSYR